MFHRFARHVKEGFIGVGRHFGMAISSISAVTITLVLIAVFGVLTWNLQAVTANIESSISIVVSVDYEAESEESLNNIEEEIWQIEGVSSVEYRTKDEEFDYYANMQGEEEREFYAQYRNSNPFHDVFLVSVDEGLAISEITEELSSINGVYGVYDGGTNTYTLVSIFANVHIFGGILVIALCLLATYLVYNTIKITIASRSDEIWIMRNVGAKNGYVRAPFLVEGVIIGTMGSLVPIILTVAVYYLIYDRLGGSLFGAFNLVAPYPFVLYMSLILLGIGVVVGFLGSYISVCKYLRVRR